MLRHDGAAELPVMPWSVRRPARRAGPVIREELSVTIGRPIGDVFAVLSDPEKTSRWFPGAVRARWASAGPVGVGSVRHSERRVFGRTFEHDAEVTVFRRDSELGWRSISGPVPFEISIRLFPVPGGARVDWRTEMRPGEGHRRSLALLSRMHRREMRRGLENLRGFMESGLL